MEIMNFQEESHEIENLIPFRSKENTQKLTYKIL